MSWKNDIFSTLQALAMDIKTIRSVNSPEDLAPIGPDLAAHISQLFEVVNSLDDSTHENIIEAAKAIKTTALPLLRVVTAKNHTEALNLIGPVANQVKELNQLLKSSDEEKLPPSKPELSTGSSDASSTANSAVVPVASKVEEVKKVLGEIKEALLEINRAHKAKDEELAKEASADLLGECKKLITISAEVGFDVKKNVVEALKKVENNRLNASTEELQEALKEFHKVVKDVEKLFKSTEDKAAKQKKPRTSASQQQQQQNSIINFVEKEDPTDLFTLTKELGKGATGSVHMAVAKNSKVFAIKKVPLTMKNLAATHKEIKFMRKIQHANTLTYYNCYKRGNEVWIVMELCDGGSVQDILDKTGKGIEEPYIAAITVQVLSGLEYLHGLQTIHRDIKSGNLLLTSEGKVKIADFGASADSTNRTTVIGSSYWMAPETLDQSGYDTRADIWSLGITLIEIAEKDPPYFELDPPEVVRQIMYGAPPFLKQSAKWSENFKQFVKFCLQREKNKRPGATILLQHPFVKDITDTSCLATLVAEVKQLSANNKASTKPPESTPIPTTENPTPTPTPTPAPNLTESNGSDPAEILDSLDNKSDKAKAGEIPRRKSSKKVDKGIVLNDKGEKIKKSTSEKGEKGEKGEKRSSKSLNKTAGAEDKKDEKIKVHLGSENNIAKRIAVEPNIDVVTLTQKCFKQFKIDKADSSAYALYLIQNGTCKKLQDNELPYQILNSSKKEDLQLVYKKQ